MLCSRVRIRRAVARWWRVRSVVVCVTRSALLFASCVRLSLMDNCKSTIEGCSFGMCRCRKEGLVLGERRRQRERVCVWRWVERREAILGRGVGRVDQRGVPLRVLDWEGVRAGEERWEERSMMSSRRSGGRVACVWDCLLSFVVVVVEVDVDEGDERSRFRSADLRSWDLALRKREAFNACSIALVSATSPSL